ncbi:GntR family transcriptional regulator [Microtetraspora sp. NBRC 13810]|uniref:GntR family transcriptional regulator n=1 Tax=Microtetraspora sp. NBRC 13810 TaxID=3030990 RepID=UPI0024A4A2AA|nr:GntR family transcriptional regulator [Microtetraspora sp. NBRC 13810]GLW08680.1 GntR family transcriptional regulator [Microtetraspora sp. NBRC 13810]
MRSDVYRRLREDILSGGLAAETPLVEAALADRYGTSRTPVREALRRLEQDGLVERADRSLRVRARSPEEILEIYEVRISLEGVAARAAAERHTPYDLARLRAEAGRMAATPADDPRAMADANRRFHEAIYAAGHNATLLDLLTRLNDHLARYPATTLSHPGRWHQARTEHEALLAAIAARDAPTAATLAEQHMTTARDIRLLMYSTGS